MPANSAKLQARRALVERVTKETSIRLELNMDARGPQLIGIGLPFFEHMLHAMSFHGAFGLEIAASGDIDVDPHHLVEDMGLALGEALDAVQDKTIAVKRYGSAIIPMDEALSEVVIDACRRPYLVYRAQYPQPLCGTFDVSLFREFFQALSARARINLHAHVRYGENSHHMAESLFKALGIAIKEAYAPAPERLEAPSTKGVL